jgi:DNA mismatch repair protein MutL
MIKILPEDLINKIAAGEVVERPASVVKELIENSIDAGASKISVEIQNAGRKLIRVSDNGQGMTKDEISLAVQRHSTSKISSFDDLFNIQTLGFRGEALPSIASVSRLDIMSRKSNTDDGNSLIVVGGKTEKSEEIGCPAGTTVTIKELFFNTPARKKFLKSPATEMGHIGDIASKYTIANPNIAFELISDGKPLLSSPGSGNLKDAVIAVYGVDLLKELIETEFSFQFGKVHGLTSRPTLSRIDRTYETFYVNQRYVRNFLLNRALEEAYRTLIPHNRYPIAILFVDIDPKQVDVNVHPAKREIKFVKTQEVMDAVRSSVGEALSKVSIGYQDTSVPVGEYQSIRVSEGEGQMIRESDTLFPRIETVQEAQFEVSAVQPLFPIYQHKDTYIICTDGEDVVLIDQHEVASPY